MKYLKLLLVLLMTAKCFASVETKPENIVKLTVSFEGVSGYDLCITQFDALQKKLDKAGKIVLFTDYCTQESSVTLANGCKTIKYTGTLDYLKY